MISKFRNLLHHRVHYENHGQIKTFWSGCGAIKRQAFLTLGGFDEGFRTASVEDIELGYRLSASGHKIFLDHSVQVCHHKSWSLFSMCYTDCFLRARPWTRLMLSERNLGTTKLNVSIKDKVMLATLLAAYLLIPISIAFPTYGSYYWTVYRAYWSKVYSLEIFPSIFSFVGSTLYLWIVCIALNRWRYWLWIRAIGLHSTSYF